MLADVSWCSRLCFFSLLAFYLFVSMSGRLKSPASMMILLQLLAKRDSESWSKISAPVFGGR